MVGRYTAGWHHGRTAGREREREARHGHQSVQRPKLQPGAEHSGPAAHRDAALRGTLGRQGQAERRRAREDPCGELCRVTISRSVEPEQYTLDHKRSGCIRRQHGYLTITGPPQGAI